jgi:protein-disulfide isomerase
MVGLAMLLPLVAAVGLAGSGLLLVDYTGAASLCGPGGGCDVVKASAWARPLGVPLPVFGVAFFALLLLLTARPRFLRPVALVGGAVGVVLLALQLFVLHAVCTYCAVVDGAAIAAAVLAFLPHRPRPRATAAFAALALAVPAVTFATREPPPPPVVSATLPEPVAREQRAGWVTIVEFLDFQCPYCRKLHVALEEAMHGLEKVRVVRKMMPLASHPHARPAALAYCCAETAGKGDAMADNLMRRENLDAEGCAQAAAEIGLDAEAFRACLASDAPARRIAADEADAQVAGVRGLPTYWIGETRYVGAPSAEVLRERILAATPAR